MLSDDSDTESIHQLTINEHFAKAYEYKKEREELSKLKEKYGSDAEDDDGEDSEDAESEDEDGEELTPAVDAAILRTLARIKRKDPSIYDAEKDVFEEERNKTGGAGPSARAPRDKSKPLTMRQHALASALRPHSRSPSPSPPPPPPTHAEEQKALRGETIAAFHTAVSGGEESEGEGEGGGLLVPREKTRDEVEREEEEYREFLRREVGEDLRGLVSVDGDVGESLWEEDDKSGKEKKKKKKKEKKEKKKEEHGKSKQEEDHEFLMNYILNRGWIDRDARRLPTYHDVTGSRSRKRTDGSGSDGDGVNEPDNGLDNGLDDDGEVEFDDIADRFESSYNFRFEEPDASTIPRYPRTLPSLVRRPDTARKDAREKRKARKEEEVRQKKEEVRRLKALKMKELREKLERVGVEGGKSLEENEALRELDLDADWDPDAHDRQMAKIYEQEGEGDEDEEKPRWDDDIDIGDIVPPEASSSSTSALPPKKNENKKKKKKKKKAKDEDGGGDGGVDVDEMDADVDVDDDGEWAGTDDVRKRKLDEHMDEIYGLDFNDMVGGIPTRFKYAKVPPQSFALSPVEILLATDAELNAYMGIKKYAPYRKDARNWDRNRAARLKELKDRLRERESAWARGDGGEAGEKEVKESERQGKKRKGKKERMKERAGVTATAGVDGEDRPDGGEDVQGAESQPDERKRKADADGDGDGNSGPSKKKRRRHKKSGVAQAD